MSGVGHKTASFLRGRLPRCEEATQNLSAFLNMLAGVPIIIWPNNTLIVNHVHASEGFDAAHI